MKKFISLLFILTSLLLQAQIPFEQTPSFETNPLGHYATGLGIADINGDGWKDIITANGNDMARQRLAVYYNQGDGTFPLNPSWQSDDIDYHGHLSAGDVDNDGDVDIAVSVYLGPNGFGDPGKAKIYYNTGNELEGTPSFQTESVYTFSCALGDADADGDLDLALACGEPYGGIYLNAKVFYNDKGVFNPVAGWESNVQMGAMDVEFADIDRNGFLDLAFVCEETDNYIFLSDDVGNIDENWDWISDYPDNYMNSVDFGKPCNSTSPALVMTGNDQLGGDGKAVCFVFNEPIPQTSPPIWESDYIGYGSGILLANITNDGNNELLYGSWWGPLTILQGDCGIWIPTPVYQANETSVVEAILMSDLGKFNYQASSRTIKAVSELGLMYLDQQIIESINAVYKNGILLDRTEYAYTELKNWISFKEHIMDGDMVTIEYEYMEYGDIVISNWDANRGNFIYYNNNNPVGIPERDASSGDLRITGLSPQPSGEYLHITYKNENQLPLEISLHDLSGRKMGLWTSGEIAKTSISIGHLPEGMYILGITDGLNSDKAKVLVSR